MPIDGYGINPYDYYLIDKAKTVLIDRCMKAFGSRFIAPSPGKPVVQASRRYGVTETETAAAYGYHMPKVADRANRDPRNLTKEDRIFLFGESNGRSGGSGKADKLPPGGCSGEADAKISGDDTPDAIIALARGIDGGSFENSMKDPRWVKANKQWSACMMQRGYRYASPLEAISDPKFQEVGRPTEQERRVAVRDVQCKRESSLTEIWREIESADQEMMIRKHSKELQRLRSFQKAEVGRARRVLSDSP
ncbi:hypothetical protein [Streptomyces griseochromogenes]|uniref:hypothetical protein n=1 Tax=Streptomyces griseochromogenes TaxID=68214 RepID=UPI00379B2B25